MPNAPPTYIIAIDQGTSGTSACLYDHNGQRIARADVPLASLNPQPSWVEQDPYAVLDSIRLSVRQLVAQQCLAPEQIAGVGLANQGESLLLWDRATGEPVYNLISWQDTRSLDVCQRLHAEGIAADFTSAPACRYTRNGPPPRSPGCWRTSRTPGACCEQDRLAFSMGDAWLLHQLSHGELFSSDRSTTRAAASITCTAALGMLPCCVSSKARACCCQHWSRAPGNLARSTSATITACRCRGMILDQASALLGQGCTRPGELKITYGTCIGLWCNVGSKPRLTSHLDCSVAWQVGKAPIYASVGEADSGSSVLTWLRQKFHLPWRDEQLSTVAEAAMGGEDLVFVPALKGLDAPYACPPARGVISGLDPDTGLEHVLRAALQAVASTAADLVCYLGQEIKLDEGTPIRADGGMTANEYLMQLQADILGRPLLVSSDPEATAHGAANLVRLALGAPPGLEGLREAQPSGRIYKPHMPAAERERRISRWQRAVEKY